MLDQTVLLPAKGRRIVAHLTRLKAADVGIVDDEAQRIAPSQLQELWGTQRVDRPQNLRAIGSERNQQTAPGFDGMHRHADQIGRVKLLEHEIPRCLARANDRRWRGKREVEQQQEVTPRRRWHRAFDLDTRLIRFDDVEVDYAESNNLPLLAFVENCEVIYRQASHR